MGWGGISIAQSYLYIGDLPANQNFFYIFTFLHCALNFFRGEGESISNSHKKEPRSSQKKARITKYSKMYF